jgi:hypothetical protein
MRSAHDNEGPGPGEKLARFIAPIARASSRSWWGRSSVGYRTTLELAGGVGECKAIDGSETRIGLELRRRLLESRLEGTAVAGPRGVKQGEHWDLVMPRVLVEAAFVE